MHMRGHSRSWASGSAVLILLVSGVAGAHFDLVLPPPADTALDGGKGFPPCGPTTASNVVTPAQGGHPLAIQLNETTLHPGHYRIALSVNSRAELPDDPIAVAVNGVSVSAPIQNPPQFPVLADGVFVHTTGTVPIPFQTSIILPNITCAKCTLQVIEFMANHGLNTPGGGFYYHHCADLQITADPNLPRADAGVPDAGGSDAPIGTGGGGAGGGNSGTGGRNNSGTGGSAGGGGNPGTGGSGTGGSSGSTGGSNSGTGGTGGTNSGGGGNRGTVTDAGTSGTGGSRPQDAGTQPASTTGCGCGIASGAQGIPVGGLLIACLAGAMFWHRSRRRS